MGSIESTLQRDMENYEQFLAQAIADESLVIPSNDANTSALMMSKLFEQTTRQVVMILGDFDDKLSNNQIYVESLDNILNKQHIKFGIITLKEPNIESKAFKLLMRYKALNNDSIHIKAATELTKQQLRELYLNREQLAHFSVFDNNKFRFEYSPQQHAAFGSFNNTRKAEKLLSDFKTLYASATDIENLN